MIKLNKKNRINAFSAENLGSKSAFPPLDNEQIVVMNKIIDMLKELGIDDGGEFDSGSLKNDEISKDEYIARMCIYNGEEVPDEVRYRLLNRKCSKQNERSKTVEINISDKYVEDMLNGKYSNK